MPQVVIQQDDFSAGISRDFAPTKADERSVRDCNNGLLSEDGSIFKRGGTVNESNAPFGISLSNIFSNPSFETNTTGWSTTNATLTRTNAWAYEGTWSGRAVATHGTFAGLIDTTVPVDPDHVYDLEVPFNVVANAGTGIFVYVSIVDAGGIQLDTLSVDPLTGTGEQVCRFSFETSGSADEARISIILPPGSDAYFDDVRGYQRVTSSDGLRFLTDLHFNAGHRTVLADTQNFGVLDSDEETPLDLGGDGMNYAKSAVALEGLLFIGGGYIYGGSRKPASYSTGTVSVTNGGTQVTGSGVTWNTLVDAGMLFQVGSGRVYVVASITDSTHLELTEPYQEATSSGNAYNLHNLYKIQPSDPYIDSDYYTVCGGRLIAAEGDKVRFSEIDSLTGLARPHDYAIDIAGESYDNFHKLPEGVRITGFGVIRSTLLIFTNAGVWTLDGLVFDIVDENGNSQHRLSVLSRDLILWTDTGIATWDQALVVPCVDGVWMIDGSSGPQKISRPIDTLIARMATSNYRCGQATVFNNHYFLPITDGAGRGKEHLVCRLDRPVKSRGTTIYPWTRFSGQPKTITAYARRIGVDAHRDPTLLGASGAGDARVLDCSGYFEPKKANRYDADGTVPRFEVVTRDYETGSGTLNRVRRFRVHRELKDAAADNPKIRVLYSTGTVRSSGAKFGEAQFGAAKFGAGSSAMTDLGHPAPEDPTGTSPHKCRVNKRTRFIRGMLRNVEPAESCAVRSFEVNVIPSKAVRR